jgi:hypothetical protein
VRLRKTDIGCFLSYAEPRFKKEINMKGWGVFGRRKGNNGSWERAQKRVMGKQM